MKKTIYAGTYTGQGSEGIYAFSHDDGVLSDQHLFCAIRNPKYLTVHGSRIAALGDFARGSGVALISSSGEILDTLAFEQRTSCYITWQNDLIYTANYHEGTFSVLSVQNDHLKLVQTVLIRDGAGCHQVLLHGSQILVPCLFLDRVLIFDADLHRVGSICFAAGTGPRHGVFTADGKTLYLVSELSNELFAIRTDDWTIRSSVSVLPGGKTHQRDTAAIRLSADEKYLYVSTRTADILSVISADPDHLQLQQTVSCGGRHPRDFILDGSSLLCANRYSNAVAAFDCRDGMIGSQTGSIAVPSAVCLAAAE